MNILPIEIRIYILSYIEYNKDLYYIFNITHIPTEIIKNYYNKMGASLVYLNEPNTEIEHETGENEFL